MRKTVLIDKLIEYLLLNVIDGIGGIPQNCQRINKAMGISDSSSADSEYSNYLRYKVYDLAQNSIGINKEDLVGYVDSVCEKLIMKGAR